MGRKKTGFLRGAAVLTGGMLLVKLAGALFKIPLNREIGQYGMGLFHVAYSFYGPIFSLATAGFPVAVSRLVSEAASLGEEGEILRLRRAAFPLYFGIGLAGTLLLGLLAPVYCLYFLKNPYALAPLLALAPAILFACLAAVYRGCFEGRGQMEPTALSQILEAVVKLAVGLGGAKLAVELGSAQFAREGKVLWLTPADGDAARFLILSLGAAAAVFGVTCASGASLLYLYFRDRKSRPAKMMHPAPGSSGNAAARLMKLTVPIALGSIASNAAGLVDATILQGRIAWLTRTRGRELLESLPMALPELYAQHPESIPTYLYGCYTLAMTVYLLVPSLSQAFAVSALPAVTAAWARKDRRALSQRIRTVAGLTAALCFPAGLGLWAVSGPAVAVLFGEEASSALVAGLLQVLAIAALGAGLCAPLSSMLQAVGRADLPVKLLAAAMMLKLALTWLLSGSARLHLYGGALGSLAAYWFLAGAQMWALGRVSGLSIRWGTLLIKPLASALLCAAAARCCTAALAPFVPSGRGGQALLLTAAVACGGAVYAAGILLVEPKILKNGFFQNTNK